MRICDIYNLYYIERKKRYLSIVISSTFSIFLFKSRMSGGGKDGTGTEGRD